MTGGRLTGWNAPDKWLTYQAALAFHERGKGNGIGIVMRSDRKVAFKGEEYYLAALDFDRCMERSTDIKRVGLRLSHPYVELSPSGKGLRMFALSKELLKGGNDGNGHELYCKGKFLTVTGWGGRGKIKDVTAGLVGLHQEWFGAKETPAKIGFGSNSTHILKTDDVPEHVRKLNATVESNMLSAEPDRPSIEILRHLTARNYFEPRFDNERDEAGRFVKVGWIKCGMALKAAYGDEVGFELWGITHADDRARNDAPGQWQSFAAVVRPGDVRIGTIIKAAIDSGFDPVGLSAGELVEPPAEDDSCAVGEGVTIDHFHA